MKMDYVGKINEESAQESRASEPTAVDSVAYRHAKRCKRSASDNVLDKRKRYEEAREFAIKHFDSSFVQQLQKENFLLDSACANEDAAEFEDIKQMYADAEASGSYTQKEAENIFLIWR